jgi:hypothetical protein
VTPQNRSKTGLAGRHRNGRFRRGISGNPGGRPRAIATVILEQRPTTSEDLVALWALIAFGSPMAVRRKYGVTPRL